MPKVFSPDRAAWPDDVAAAVEVLGSPIRLEILKHLADNPGLHLGPLYEAVAGLGRTSFIGHLHALETAGAIYVDLPPEQRKGRSPRYFVERDRLEALTVAWLGYVSGGRSPQ